MKFENSEVGFVLGSCGRADGAEICLLNAHLATGIATSLCGIYQCLSNAKCKLGATSSCRCARETGQVSNYCPAVKYSIFVKRKRLLMV